MPFRSDSYKYVKPTLLEETIRSEESNLLSDLRLDVVEYDSAVLYPAIPARGGGIVDKEGRFVPGTSIHVNVPGQEGPYEDEIVESDEEVQYLGMFCGVWGHCLTDCLQRLWPFVLQYQKDNIRSHKFVYATSAWLNGVLPENFRQMLSALGIDWANVIRVDRPTRFRKICVPESCFFYDFSSSSGRTIIRYTEEYRQVVEQIIFRTIGGKPPKRNRKIYFSRNAWQGRLTFGESLVENAFRRCGFEIVHPERLTFEETVCLMQSARVLASTCGSCAHNAIFMPKGAKLIVVRKSDFANPYQTVINKTRDLDVTYVDANLSCFLESYQHPWGGPFFIYVNKRLSKLIGVPAHFPVFLFISYFMAWVKIRLKRKP